MASTEKIIVSPPYALDNAPSGSESGVERLEYPAALCARIIHVLWVLLVILLVWSALARIDIVASGKGKLLPKGDVKIVQPPSDGTISKMYVTEGQAVHAGDKLVLLDRTPLAADVEKQQQDLELTLAELRRHQSAAESLTAAIADPSRLPEDSLAAGVGTVISDLYSSYKQMKEIEFDAQNDRVQTSILSDRSTLRRKLQNLSEQKASMESSLGNKKLESAVKEQEAKAAIEESKKQLTQAVLQRGKMIDALERTKEQVSCAKEAYQSGAVSKVDYLTAMKRVDQEEGSIMEIDAKISELKHQVEANKMKLTELKSDVLSTVDQSQSLIKRTAVDLNNTEMQAREIDRKLSLSSANLKAALARAKAALQKESDDLSDCKQKIKALELKVESSKHIYDVAEIKAPVDGTVTAIKVKVDGQVVARGQELMTIVPSSTGLLLEAQIANKDFGFVELKQKAKIKLDAFPYQDYGTINGTVVEVESTPQQNEELGSYFNIRILPERTWIAAQGRKVNLTNGMAAEADIVIRNKSVLEFMLEPVAKLAHVSIKE